jgi:hypothetical protein
LGEGERGQLGAQYIRLPFFLGRKGSKAEGGDRVLSFLNSALFKNWLTTILGLAAGSPVVIDGLQKTDWNQVWAGIALALLGIFAKQANVTGGTTKQ